MKKSFYLVLTSISLLVLGTYISGTVLTPYAKNRMGATWFEIGLLSGSMYVIRLIFGTPIGRLADKRGTIKVLKYSLILYPFIAITYYFAWNMYSLMAARLFHGIASAMMIPMGMAYVGHVSPEGREGKYMSIYNLSIILASGIGTTLSTVIAGYVDYKATFLVLFLLAVLALLILHFSNAESEPEEEQREQRENKQRITNGRQIKSLRQNGIAGLMALGIANIALAVVSSLMGSFIQPFLAYKGIELKYTGSFIAIYYLISGLIQIPLGKFIDHHNKYILTLLSGLITAAALIIFPMSENAIIICLGMALTAFGYAALLTTTSSLSVFIGRQRGMGNTMGFLSTANSAGMIFGSLSLGLLPGKDNHYALLFYFTGIVLITSTVMFSVLWKNKNCLHLSSLI